MNVDWDLVWIIGLYLGLGLGPKSGFAVQVLTYLVQSQDACFGAKASLRVQDSVISQDALLVLKA